MQKGLLLLCLVAGLIQQVVADPSSYKLNVTRSGKVVPSVAIDFWGGEYPSPVIVVGNRNSETTTIKAYKSLRQLQNPTQCTISNGIYHPWSKTKNSVEIYYTIVSQKDFKALKNITVNEQQISKGAIIGNVHYLSEGYCGGVLKHGKIKKTIDFLCDDVDTPNFQQIGQAGQLSEQWLYLKCREGYKAFVQDTSLLAQPNVKEGHIKEYGKVTGF